MFCIWITQQQIKEIKMNYLEIILWLQSNLIGLIQKINGQHTITYMDDNGLPIDHYCTDLVSGVLSITGKELVE